MNTPFHNNLEKNDRVFDTESKRQAKVARTPRGKARLTAITYDGTTTPRYVDVMQLRLMPDGRTPEDCPPIEGTPPEKFDGADPDSGSEPDALTSLRAELAKNNAEMSGMNARFKTLREQNDRIEKAIAILAPV